MRSLALLCLVACGGARTAGPASAFAADAFYWAYYEHNPKDGVVLGYHQYDGRLPDASPAALEEWGAAMARAEGKLAAHAPAALSATAGDPRVHIGQLTNALLRDVRFASALGLHTSGMSVAASANLFRTRAYAGDDEALQQAVRGTFDPLYLNYTLGKVVIEKLRADWMAKTGKCLKAFHDAFLGYACAPLPLIRREMMGEEGRLL